MVIWISVIAAVLAFGLTWLAGVWFIPFLHKLKYGQTILDIGPKWHKAKKQGTPTMGGIMFIIAVSVCFACAVILFGPLGGKNFAGEDRQELVRAVSGLIMAVMFGFMGFLDDFIKVKKKHNEGLTVMQKIVIQVLIIAAYFATLYLSGMTRTAILFPWGWTWELGWLYYPIMGVVILYLVNAVNLTDGIDGLCSCVTVVYMAAFACISGILGMYCETLLALLTAGGCIGFLMWNFPPAKVFMGRYRLDVPGRRCVRAGRGLRRGVPHADGGAGLHLRGAFGGYSGDCVQDNKKDLPHQRGQAAVQDDAYPSSF